MPVSSVLLDANVLVPLSVRDTLLRAVEHGVFRAHWTEEILEEAWRTLVGKQFMTQTKAIELIDAIRDAFPNASIVGYGSEIARMTNHPDDRHVAAAAWHRRVDAIVTFNIRHFPHPALAPFSLHALLFNAFLMDYFAASPDAMVESIRQQARERTRPILTPVQILDRLAKLTPQFAAAVPERLDV